MCIRDSKGGRSSGRQRSVYLSVEPGLDMPSLASHPEDHPGEQAGRHERNEAFYELLCGPLESPDRIPENETGGDRDEDRCDRARPYPTRLAPAFEAIQIAEEDGDDDRRLEPLTQHHEECGHDMGSLLVFTQLPLRHYHYDDSGKCALVEGVDQ